MATSSFDERVVVTDKETIEMMKRDLETPADVVYKRQNMCTIEKAEANGKKWAEILFKQKNTEMRLFDEIKTGLEQAIEYNDERLKGVPYRSGK